MAQKLSSFATTRAFFSLQAIPKHQTHSNYHQLHFFQTKARIPITRFNFQSQRFNQGYVQRPNNDENLVVTFNNISLDDLRHSTTRPLVISVLQSDVQITKSRKPLSRFVMNVLWFILVLLCAILIKDLIVEEFDLSTEDADLIEVSHAEILHHLTQKNIIMLFKLIEENANEPTTDVSKIPIVFKGYTLTVYKLFPFQLVRVRYFQAKVITGKEKFKLIYMFDEEGKLIHFAIHNLESKVVREYSLDNKMMNMFIADHYVPIQFQKRHPTSSSFSLSVIKEDSEEHFFTLKPKN